MNSVFLRALFGSRELLLFASAHVRQIRANNTFRVSRPAYLAAVEPQRFVAEPLDQTERMGHEQDRFAPPLEFAELIEALVGKAFVSNGEYFVHEQDVRIDVNRHGKAEAHVHSRRVRFDWCVDELLHLGELDDLVEAPSDLALGEAEHDAVDEHVLAA